MKARGQTWKDWFWPWGRRRGLVASMLVLVAVALIASCAISVRSLRGELIDRIDAEMAAEAERARTLAALSDYDIEATIEALYREVLANERVSAVVSPAEVEDTVILDESGRFRPLSLLGQEEPNALALWASQLGVSGLRVRIGHPVTADLEGVPTRILIDQIGDSFVVNGSSIEWVEETVDSTRGSLTFLNLAIFLVVGFAIWICVRLLFRGVDQVTETARLIRAGELSHRAPAPDPRTEVGVLAGALNDMLERLDAAFAAQSASEARLRQFVDDASHELRTPVTSIRGYAELCRGGAADDPQAVRQAIGRIESEATRMGRLVEDLLVLARLDQARLRSPEPLDLASIVSDAVKDARAVEPSRPIRFRRADGPLVVSGDEDRLRQMIGNLLGNVRMHTDPDVAVEVEIGGSDGWAVLRVIDHGPGMHETDAARAFDRFYRSDAARARTRSGSGLGLAIVAATVQAHGGTVTLDTAFAKGTTVTVTLPLAGISLQ